MAPGRHRPTQVLSHRRIVERDVIKCFLTTTGEILEIEVTGFEGDHILAPDRRVALSDIDSLEIKRLNRGSLYITLGAIGGAILLLKSEDETCSSYSVCDGYLTGYRSL